MLAAAQTKAIGSFEYEVLPLPAGVSIRLMTRVLKMSAPAFAEVSSLRDAASAVGTMLAAGLAELDEEIVMFACGELAKVTQIVVDGGARKIALQGVFDEHFRGRVPDLMAWMRFAAEVTYGPLGGALKSALGSMSPVQDETQRSPSAG
jgi:hypothetical protein